VLFGKVYKPILSRLVMEIRADLHCHGPEEWLGTSKWNPWDISALVVGKLEVMAITEVSHLKNTPKKYQDLRFDKLMEVAKIGRAHV
jgi:hypothetical protein